MEENGRGDMEAALAGKLIFGHVGATQDGSHEARQGTL